MSYSRNRTWSLVILLQDFLNKIYLVIDVYFTSFNTYRRAKIFLSSKLPLLCLRSSDRDSENVDSNHHQFSQQNISCYRCLFYQVSTGPRFSSIQSYRFCVVDPAIRPDRMAKHLKPYGLSISVSLCYIMLTCSHTFSAGCTAYRCTPCPHCGDSSGERSGTFSVSG